MNIYNTDNQCTPFTWLC